MKKSKKHKKIYARFLNRCLKENVKVVTTNKQSLKIENGRCEINANGKGAEITIYRDSQYSSKIDPKISPPDVEDFINRSSNPIKELCVLLHEFGHFFHRHSNDRNRATSDPVNFFKEEIDAWNFGEKISKQIGFKKARAFKKSRKTALNGYLNLPSLTNEQKEELKKLI
jgi:hypothetical protein